MRANDARPVSVRHPARRRAVVISLGGLSIAAVACAAVLSMRARTEAAVALDVAARPVPVHTASIAAGVETPVISTNVSTSTAEAAGPIDADLRWFNGRPIRPARTMRMRVTAYSPDERSCGEHADGITASGYSVLTNAGRLVAADTSVLPFGSIVSIEGYDHGAPVPVLDRGGAIRGNRLDVLFPTHEAALEWGVRMLDVVVWEYADGQPDGFRTNHHP